MIKISNTRLKFDNRKVIIKVRKPFLHMFLSTLGLSLFAWVILTTLAKDENAFFTILFVLAILQFIYVIGLNEESILDTELRNVIRKKKLFNFCFKKVDTSWESPYYFKYTVHYDSYKNITAIWLIASAIETNKSHQLLRFFNKTEFIKFQELFNEEFPENKILEWHD